VNCDLINNKNSTLIKLETGIVDILCQLKVKYYIFIVLIFECIISIKIKIHPFLDILLYEYCFDVGNSLLKYVQHFRYTLYSRFTVVSSTPGSVIPHKGQLGHSKLS
jgi:hypothetical protein